MHYALLGAGTFFSNMISFLFLVYIACDLYLDHGFEKTTPLAKTQIKTCCIVIFREALLCR